MPLYSALFTHNTFSPLAVLYDTVSHTLAHTDVGGGGRERERERGEREREREREKRERERERERERRERERELLQFYCQAVCHYISLSSLQ